jgi:hypothetical protein
LGLSDRQSNALLASRLTTLTVHPQLLILAVTRVAGELGASAALASGQEVEKLLGELAEVLQQAGRDRHEMLQAELLPVAGNA